MKLNDLIAIEREKGYNLANAEAKVCQDIVLKVISESSFNRNVTIKGGVVMRSISGNMRRATQDIDLDFIKYSLSDDSIDAFINKLNCLQGIIIERTGPIKEMKQQDYHGKRVLIRISDEEGRKIDSKIDIGVHKHLEVEQQEYCFDIAFDDEGASLLINSYEQMFTEKLKPMLKLGRYSTRYRDIFDLYYLKDIISKDSLKKCIDALIINDPEMREQDMETIISRFEKSAMERSFLKGAERTDRNWLDIEPERAVKSIADFLKKL